MSGETEQHVSGWTVDTLKEFVSAAITAADVRYEQRFLAQEKAVKDALTSQEKAVNAALAASEKAVFVAEQNAEKWRTNANEWRGSMNDREAKFVQVPEFLALKERIDKSEGHGKGVSDLWGWLVAAIAIIIAVVSHFK